MNRLILIGNGFDLAHNFKTSYANFINWYFKDLIEQVCSCQSDIYDDSLCKFSIISPHDLSYRQETKLSEFTKDKVAEYFRHKLSLTVNHDKTDPLKVELSPLIKKISQQIETKKWVDIENEYYELLKDRFRGNSSLYPNVDTLNNHMSCLTQKLAEYLDNITGKISRSEIFIKDIQKYMMEPFSIEDISVGGKQTLYDHVNSRLNYIEKDWTSVIDGYDATLFPEITKRADLKVTYNGINEYLKDKQKFRELPIVLRVPDKIMLLNFNYTGIADFYLPRKDAFEINHIHGELSNVKQMIFGYGDELDDDFMNILKRNENSYLTNIKSIRYLEVDNYRKLLSFIDSSPFQIYIMGHSCGNSDRTMLNTLFEHKNW